MRLTKFRLPIVLLLFVVAINARAALIDQGSYLTDTVSGLDWLKLTQTVNRTYNDVSSQLDEGGEFAGWRYATSTEFEALLLNQGITADQGCSDGTNFCGGVHSENYATISNLVNQIGDTFEQAYGGSLTSSAYASLGVLADFTSGGFRSVGLLAGFDTPYARTVYTLQNDVASATHIGSFLIRTSEVPLPAGGYLFISAMVGLLGMFGRLRPAVKN